MPKRQKKKSAAIPAAGDPVDAAKRNTLTDYISGQSIRDTPEEREAVQVFARRLVEDYGYTQGRHRIAGASSFTRHPLVTA